jgi:hypothetical protein
VRFALVTDTYVPQLGDAAVFVVAGDGRDADHRAVLSAGARRAATNRDVAIEDQQLLTQYAALTHHPPRAGVTCAA